MTSTGSSQKACPGNPTSTSCTPVPVASTCRLCARCHAFTARDRCQEAASHQDEPAMASCRMHRQAFFEERDGLYAVRVGGVPPGDPVFLALQAQVGTPGLAAFLATGRIHRRLSRGRPPGSGFRIEQALGRHPDEPGLIEVVQPARWVG